MSSASLRLGVQWLLCSFPLTSALLYWARNPVIVANEQNRRCRAQYTSCASTAGGGPIGDCAAPVSVSPAVRDSGGLLESHQVAQQAPFRELLSSSSWFFPVLLAHGALLEGLSDFTVMKTAGRRDSCYSKTAPHGWFRIL